MFGGSKPGRGDAAAEGGGTNNDETIRLKRIGKDILT